MTCREFTEVAESLTPSQLLRMGMEDERVSAHVRDCAACGKWLESQKLLGNALQVLRADTAKRQASPRVEQAVLQAFRSQGFEPATAVAPDFAAPAAWKLSRFFEVGAYAAVAAALIVGTFVGARMWRDRQELPKQVQAQAATVQPTVPDSTATVAAGTKPAESVPAETAHKHSAPAAMKSAVASAKLPQAASAQAATTAVDRQGFVALMLCDPLICSGEEQVIRMELPGSTMTSADGSGTRPVVADVVVGDDGLVRAMRIVN